MNCIQVCWALAVPCLISMPRGRQPDTGSTGWHGSQHTSQQHPSFAEELTCSQNSSHNLRSARALRKTRKKELAAGWSWYIFQSNVFFPSAMCQTACLYWHASVAGAGDGRWRATWRRPSEFISGPMVGWLLVVGPWRAPEHQTAAVAAPCPH